MGLSELAELLLDEEEGTTLDFKQQQYLFDGASDVEKSELLKDILAFANASRRTDAYIFIGAKEVKGGRSQVLGVAQHIDDAKLQQFVNSKTNRPVEFSYRAFEMEGKRVALIHLPVQQRPTYLKQDYGKVHRGSVYIRHGSSTAIALPEEIAKMGAAASVELKAAPSLSACLVSGLHDETFGTSMTLAVVDVQIPDESEFPLNESEIDCGGGFTMRMAKPMGNKHFYSNYALWWKETQRFKALKLCVENKGKGVANDVKLVLEIKKVADGMEACSHLPTKPVPSLYHFSGFHPVSLLEKQKLNVEETSDGWRVIANFGKIQAMDRGITHSAFFIGAAKSAKVVISGRIFADELSAPLPQELMIEIEVAAQSYSVDDFLQKINADEDN